MKQSDPIILELAVQHLLNGASYWPKKHLLSLRICFSPREVQESEVRVWLPQPLGELPESSTSISLYQRCLKYWHRWIIRGIERKEKEQGLIADDMWILTTSQCILANGTPYTPTASDLCIPAAGAPYTLQTTCRSQQQVQISAASSTLQDEVKVNNTQTASLGERKKSRACTYHPGISIHYPREKGWVTYSTWHGIVG